MRLHADEAATTANREGMPTTGALARARSTHLLAESSAPRPLAHACGCVYCTCAGIESWLCARVLASLLKRGATEQQLSNGPACVSVGAALPRVDERRVRHEPTPWCKNSRPLSRQVQEIRPRCSGHQTGDWLMTDSTLVARDCTPLALTHAGPPAVI